MADEPVQLHYAPPTSFRQRHLRTIVILVLLLPVAPLVFLMGRRVYPNFVADRLFSQCMSYSAPAIAYTEDAKERASLMGKPDYHYFPNTSPPTIFVWPAPWADLAMRVWGGIGTDSMLFMHERTTPSGKARLVTVMLHEVRHDTFATHGVFDLGTVERGSLTTLPQKKLLDSLHTRIGWGNAPVRFMSGIVDAKDESHFTIAFTVGGQPGLIDGWLKDDDTVSLEPRDVPLAPATTTAPAPPSPGKSP